MGIDVNIEEKITKRSGHFLAPNGEKYDSPEEYFGGKMELDLGGRSGDTPTVNPSTPRRIK